MKISHSTIRKVLNEFYEMKNQEPNRKSLRELKSLLKGFKSEPGSIPLEGENFIVVGPVKSKTLSSGKLNLNQLYKNLSPNSKNLFFKASCLSSSTPLFSMICLILLIFSNICDANIVLFWNVNTVCGKYFARCSMADIVSPSYC